MKLFNTLSKEKETFKPIKDNVVNMFVCGPTVYDYLHIGNGRTAITMDILTRVLRHSGFQVNSIMNITDIDDKIIQRARDKKISWTELTKKFEEQYLLDMKGLGISGFKYVRATKHIADIIAQVQTLLDKDFAYQIDDGIYFEISKFEEYGKLSGRNKIKQDDAQSRIDMSDQKRGWNDFCLWKFAKVDEPSWPAPFGNGRPGWHIEDTAITEHYFGPQYDIHGGGSDLIFPHHEAELTQMEAASGKVPFVKYWVHGGLLYTSGQRMGKSNNNFLTIHEVVEKYSSSIIRLMMVQGHYRSQLDFSEELLEGAKQRINKWRSVYDQTHQVIESNSGVSDDAKNITEKFIEALEDDLNTPEALAQIEAFNNLILNQGMTSDLKPIYLNFCELVYDLLGIDVKTKDITPEQKDLIRQREKARQNKNWDESDRLRAELEGFGLEIKDAEHGSIWRRI